MANLSRILQAHNSPQESISTIIALLGSPNALNTLAPLMYLSMRSPHIQLFRCDPIICFISKNVNISNITLLNKFQGMIWTIKIRDGVSLAADWLSRIGG